MEKKTENKSSVVNRVLDGVGEEVEQFLREPEYQAEFLNMAKAVGFEGDESDPDGMRTALFTIKNGNIGFVIGELNTMFQDYQILKSLKLHPLYSQFLAEYPKAGADLVKFSKTVMETGEADENALQKIIEKWTDK